MRKLRIAVAGAGLMGGWHARYAVRAGAELVAIIDRKPEAAAKLKSEFPRAEAFLDLSHCLMSCEVDVVHACTDLPSHAALIEAALRHGKHVLVEKPAVATAEELRPLLDLAGSQNLFLVPTHQFPFQRGFRRLQESRDRLGEWVDMSYVVCTAGGEGLTGARRQKILYEILPHPFSLFRGLGFSSSMRGARSEFEAAAYETVGSRPPSPWIRSCEFQKVILSEDDLLISGHFGTTQLTIFLSLRGRPTRNELIVTGTRATAWVDFFHGYSFIEPGAVSQTQKVLHPFQRGIQQLTAAGFNLMLRTVSWEPAYPGLLELIAQFYQAIREGSAPPISPEEIRECAQWMDDLHPHFTAMT